MSGYSNSIQCTQFDLVQPAPPHIDFMIILNFFFFLHSLYEDGSGRQCLLIERVMKSDAGWYTLSAINEAGMSTCNARLDVGSKCSCRGA